MAVEAAQTIEIDLGDLACTRMDICNMPCEWIIGAGFEAIRRLFPGAATGVCSLTPISSEWSPMLIDIAGSSIWAYFHMSIECRCVLLLNLHAR